MNRESGAGNRGGEAAPLSAQETAEPAIRPFLERVRAADVDVTEDSAPDRRLCLNVGAYVMFGERADEELSTVAGMVLFPEDDEEERWVLAGLVVGLRGAWAASDNGTSVNPPGRVRASFYPPPLPKNRATAPSSPATPEA